MASKLIVHIGSPKTGTSALQRWLYANRNQILASGIYLPVSVGTPNNRCLSAAFDPSRRVDDAIVDHFITRHSIVQSDYKAFREKVLCEFEAEMARSSPDLVVVTSEHFHQLVNTQDSIDDLANYLTGLFDSVLILCSFREQYSMCRSRFFTALKMGNTLRFEQILDECGPDLPLYNHLKCARMWSTAFGSDCFKAMAYSPRDGSNSITDFLDASGLSAQLTHVTRNSDRVNRSLGLFGLSVLRQFNMLAESGQVLSSSDKKTLHDFLLQSPLSQLGELHHAESAMRIFTEFSESNAQFGREFLSLTGSPFQFDEESQQERRTWSIDEIAKAIVESLQTFKELKSPLR